MLNQKNKVLYVGNFSFPSMNAAGKRVFYNGKSIESLGYDVIFAGTSKAVKDNEKTILDTKGKFEGSTYYNFPYPHSSKEWIKYKSRFNDFKVIVDDIGIQSIKTIIIYNSPSLSLFNKLLIKYCKNNGIRVISDCTDWLTTETSNKLFNLIKNTDVWYQRVVLNKKCDAVICISTYLDNYYSKDKQTILVPPLTDKMVHSEKNNENGSIKIVYAGVPFRKGIENIKRETMKDRLDLSVLFVSNLIKSGSNIVFDIFGLTKEEYLLAIPDDADIIESLNSSIRFNGEIDQKEIELMMPQYDFSILIREESRDTLAGFSTKIAESISNGVPVITTDVGDVKRYIKEGTNGLYLDMQNLDINEKLVMYFNDFKNLKTLQSSTKSNNPFYWKNYTEQFKKII